MKLMNIYPIRNMTAYNGQDTNMFLTHLVNKYPTYKKMAEKHTGYKILDNSLIEAGHALDMDGVLDAAKAIGAQEVVLPDVFMNGQETVDVVDKTLTQYERELQDYKLMAVVHGETEDEWLRTFMRLSSYPEIDVLGIPKIMHIQFFKKSYPGRARLLNKVIDTTDKEIHLLGLWDSIEELEFYGENILKIRSMDTSLFSLLEINTRSMFSAREDCAQPTIDLEEDWVPNVRIVEGANKYVEGVVRAVSENI